MSDTSDIKRINVNALQRETPLMAEQDLSNAEKLWRGLNRNDDRPNSAYTSESGGLGYKDDGILDEAVDLRTFYNEWAKYEGGWNKAGWQKYAGMSHYKGSLKFENTKTTPGIDTNNDGWISFEEFVEGNGSREHEVDFGNGNLVTIRGIDRETFDKNYNTGMNPSLQGARLNLDLPKPIDEEKEDDRKVASSSMINLKPIDSSVTPSTISQTFSTVKQPSFNEVSALMSSEIVMIDTSERTPIFHRARTLAKITKIADVLYGNQFALTRLDIQYAAGANDLPVVSEWLDGAFGGRDGVITKDEFINGWMNSLFFQDMLDGSYKPVVTTSSAEESEPTYVRDSTAAEQKEQLLGLLEQDLNDRDRSVENIYNAVLAKGQQQCGDMGPGGSSLYCDAFRNPKDHSLVARVMQIYVNGIGMIGDYTAAFELWLDRSKP